MKNFESLKKQYLLIAILCFLVVLGGCGESVKQKVVDLRNSTAELIQVDKSETDESDEDESLEENDEMQEDQDEQDEDQDLEEEDLNEEEAYVSITKKGKVRMVADAFVGGDVKFTEFQLLDVGELLNLRKSEIMALAPDYFQGWDDLLERSELRKIGEIVKGKYKGYDFLTFIAAPEGPAFGVWIYRLAYNPEDGDVIYLNDGTDTYVPYFIEGLTAKEDSLSVLRGTSMPESISIPGTNKQIDLVNLNFIEVQSMNGVPAVLNNEVYGEILSYEDGTGCFYVATPDGLYSKYVYNSGFLDGTQAEKTLKLEAGGSMKIADRYKYLEGGCGVGRTCYFVLDNVNESNLKKIGTNGDGVDFFIVKKVAESDVNSYSSEKRTVAEFYSNNKTRYEEAGMDFEDYLLSRSVLFWQDPLDRWVGLYDVDYAPVAECGKPVVYLYPEETQEVVVQVSGVELTETIPEYGENGWKVLASPDGQLVNLEDGQEYPYLFWEGKKSADLNMDRGFMITSLGLKFFLESSLNELGLNSQERADFMEFWYPIMKAENKPYYFVSFVGTEDFNKVAPLKIEPKPDTLIRVFMYYESLNKPFVTVPQTLNSISRNGFTVVEWGGNLRKN